MKIVFFSELKHLSFNPDELGDADLLITNSRQTIDECLMNFPKEHLVLFLDMELGVKEVEDINQLYAGNSSIIRVIISDKNKKFKAKDHEKTSYAADGYLTRPLSKEILLDILEDYKTLYQDQEVTNSKTVVLPHLGERGKKEDFVAQENNKDDGVDIESLSFEDFGMQKDSLSISSYKEESNDSGPSMNELDFSKDTLDDGLQLNEIETTDKESKDPSLSLVLEFDSEEAVVPANKEEQVENEIDGLGELEFDSLNNDSLDVTPEESGIFAESENSLDIDFATESDDVNIKDNIQEACEQNNGDERIIEGGFDIDLEAISNVEIKVDDKIKETQDPPVVNEAQNDDVLEIDFSDNELEDLESKDGANNQNLDIELKADEQVFLEDEEIEEGPPVMPDKKDLELPKLMNVGQNNEKTDFGPKDKEIVEKVVSVSTDELVRAQATIRYLREEREKMIAENDKVKMENEHHEREILGLRSELDEVKIELSIVKKRYGEEVEEYRQKNRPLEEKVSIYEEKIKNYQKELDRVNQKVRVDYNQIKQREKDLESKLELMSVDLSNQVLSRENKIIELKRKIDSLEFNMENMMIHGQKAKEEKLKLEDRLNRVMKTLKSSIKSLETDLEIDEEFWEKLNKLDK